MVFANRVLVEKYWMQLWALSSVTRIRISQFFSSLFIYDAFVVQIEVKENLFVILLKNVHIYSTLLENTKSIIKCIFEVVVVGAATSEFDFRLCRIWITGRNKKSVNILKRSEYFAILTSLSLKNVFSFPIGLVLERPINSLVCGWFFNIWLQAFVNRLDNS